MKKNKVALVDDHHLFRDGLAGIIKGYDDFEVILEAESGKDFISKIKTDHLPDIVLLDINMKEMDGFETADWLRKTYPDIRVLALSMYENENSVIRMIRAGARGYILKDIRKQELYEALSMIVHKGYYYSELITGNLIRAITKIENTSSSGQAKEYRSLNPKEIEFLKWACSELTYKDIASKMNLSAHTIDGYRDNLFEKLGVKSRVGLVLYAIRNKIFLVE